ncbi:uncharacterized protein CPUR_08515 [Claviceps purpurea 20.1]|uniref:Uncharacterized protein n=1 Tax=Claviceps purpurea (strain 20.1) TaxID=1111077 RepID=M1VZ37_CLAP2|nr:uncharacterized protein CPUR_08515 [Claviceps purpurea 20.1]
MARALSKRQRWPGKTLAADHYGRRKELELPLQDRSAALAKMRTEKIELRVSFSPEVLDVNSHMCNCWNEIDDHYHAILDCPTLAPVAPQSRPYEDGLGLSESCTASWAICEEEAAAEW